MHVITGLLGVRFLMRTDDIKNTLRKFLKDIFEYSKT